MMKIIIFDVLRKGFDIYKNNFKLLFKVSFIYTIIQFIQSLLSLKVWNNTLLMSFIHLILVCIILYFGSRLYISIIIIVRELIKNQAALFRIVFNESSKYFWRYIGNIILFALPIVVLLLILLFIQRSNLFFLYKYSLIILFLLAIGILISITYFVSLSVVLDLNLNNRIRYCVKLIKGNALRVFIIIFLSNILILYFPSHLINSVKLGWISSPYATLMKSTIGSLIGLIVLPFSISVGVVLYNELIRLKIIRQE